MATRQRGLCPQPKNAGARIPSRTDPCGNPFPRVDTREGIPANVGARLESLTSEAISNRSERIGIRRAARRQEQLTTGHGQLTNPLGFQLQSLSPPGVD